MDNDENADSDIEIEPIAHKRLLKGIDNLGKTQFIKKPIRSEPTICKDEFHLSKLQNEKDLNNKGKSTISINDLVQTLKKTEKHIFVGKELKKGHHYKKVLKKPLEKQVADKIQRIIGYEKCKKQLSRWDAIVTRNRFASHQVFPLDSDEGPVDFALLKKPELPKKKSELMIEMEAVEAKLRALKENKTVSGPEEDEEKNLKEKLTREELIARRKEMAYLRMRQSQKSAKERRQNKIKSKKYHRILKNEKLKAKMQEFEALKKINPEAALEKLEELELNRVKERANLRHKNTGTWAKNLKVRAKYDKAVRQDLDEQIQLGRELTEKKQVEDDDNSDVEINKEDVNLDENFDPFNPWIKKTKVKQSEEVTSLINGYRKYWLERNQHEKDIESYNASIKDIEHPSETGNLVGEKELEENSNNSDIKKPKEKVKIKGKNKKKVVENGWLIEDCHPNKIEDIDDIFDKAEDAVVAKVEMKLMQLSDNLKPNIEKDPKYLKTNFNIKSFDDLSFKKYPTNVEIDEPLNETATNDKTNTNLSKEAIDITENHKEQLKEDEDDYIAPDKYADIKVKPSKITISAELTNDKSLSMEEKRLTIAEAFIDDDIVADFEHEREEERKNQENNEIDLTLPGWGCWAGSGIPKEKQTKRLVIKLPLKERRRDENKNNVYINENANEKLKEHLVKNLPFPFDNINDFEENIKAPIGRACVPETAFRLLTRPAVITKMGQAITPMNEEVLTRIPRRPKSVIAAKIAHI